MAPESHQSRPDQEPLTYLRPPPKCAIGAFSLPLEAGDNEVAAATANNFFRWGLMLRVADPKRVHLTAK